MKYNDKLARFFKSKGLSQKKVAEKIGYKEAMISRFLRGESSFGPDFIISLLKEFPDVDLKYIFSEDENSNMVNEPNGNYGLKQENIDKELEIITEKLTEIRKVLAKNYSK